MLSGPEVINSNSPDNIFIFLHGYGQSGEFMLKRFSSFIEDFPNNIFLSPNAPYMCKEDPNNYDWLRFEGDWNDENIFKQFSITAPILNQYIDFQLDHFSLKDKNLIIVGFSQGVRVSLYSVLKRSNACKAIIGYSGALTKPSQFLNNNLSRPPICLIHGEKDSVLLAKHYLEGINALKNAGFNVQGHLLPNLKHFVSSKGLELGKKFLKDLLI